jgi:CheY-like chemotaxis protein
MNRTTQTVLLVDDNTLVRRGLRTLFESAGFVCSESQNGAEAIERVRELKPDLIVLDFSMLVMNGLEAAPLLKKILPQTPIIMFTMFANPALAKLAVAAGVTAVVSKDEALTQLLPKAESLLKSTPD